MQVAGGRRGGEHHGRDRLPEGQRPPWQPRDAPAICGLPGGMAGVRAAHQASGDREGSEQVSGLAVVGRAASTSAPIAPDTGAVPQVGADNAAAAAPGAGDPPRHTACVHFAPRSPLRPTSPCTTSPPKLHRYIEKMPRWLVLAADRVMTHYGGDAGAVWSDHPSADVLQCRLAAFTGIGQKKAAMAVEILERDLGVPVTNMERGDIAHDVHVRRVFLRTRIADRDDRDHMIAIARELHPERPGALDLPAWLIGRGWCHLGIPDCISCPLTEVCPKDIERAAWVTSG